MLLKHYIRTMARTWCNTATVYCCCWSHYYCLLDHLQCYGCAGCQPPAETTPFIIVLNGTIFFRQPFAAAVAAVANCTGFAAPHPALPVLLVHLARKKTRNKNLRLLQSRWSPKDSALQKGQISPLTSVAMSSYRCDICL